MNQRNMGVHLAGSVLDCACHACAFFHSREEENSVLLPFAKEGIEAGDKIVHILDKDYAQERRRSLTDAGIDLAVAEQGGQVDFRPWEEAHLQGGYFEQNKMLNLVDELLTGCKNQGFGLTRIWANMEWAVPADVPGRHEIVEYESRLNYVLPKYGNVVVCTYDVNKFSASLLIDVMRTHPQVIIGGILQENPFYVPPDQLLKELRHRNREAGAPSD
jgi:hypothetical protein